MMISEQARNRLTILKAISRHAPVARTQLPQQTGLSAGTVSSVTNDLVARGWVRETRDSSFSRGRPRAYLSVNPDGAVVVSAVMNGQGALAVAFVDLSGRVHYDEDHPLQSCRSIAELTQEIIRALREAIARSPVDPARIDRIGIALPALVSTRHGRILFMATMQPDSLPFTATISDALGIAVTVENALAVMARAEHWFGRAKGLDTFTLVNVSYAIGVSEYANGMPSSGANGIASELGHTKIAWDEEALPCYCGARGCATAYASMYALLIATGRVKSGHLPAISDLYAAFLAMMDQAATGDPAIIAAIARAGTYLGRLLANHVNAMDPGHILVIMPDARLHPMIAETFNAAFDENILPGMRGLVTVQFALEDPDWRWRGTAALALEQCYVSG